MGLVLSVYTRRYYREFVLPPINNADYYLDIHKSRYGLLEDLSIHLEVIDEIWKICSHSTYKIRAQVIVGGEYELDNGDAFQIITNQNEQISVLVREAETILCSYVKYDISHAQTITIGKSPNNMIRYDFQGMVSGEHAVLTRQGGSWVIQNLGKNGTYCNSCLVEDRRLLHFGDHINIVGLHLVFLGQYLAVDIDTKNVQIDARILGGAAFLNNQEPDQEEKGDPVLPGEESSLTLFHRSPRNIEKLETEEIEIENPPALQKAKRTPVLLTVGPSFTMAIPMLLGCLMMVYASRASGSSTGLFMYSGLVMAVSSAVIGVIWALVNLRYQKKMERQEELHRFEAYSRYLVEKTDEVRNKYSQNSTALAAMYPEAIVCAGYGADTPQLWNRNDTHEDFLQVRIGLGDIPFQAPINVAKKKFTLNSDSLEDKPGVIRDNYKTLYRVPILLDLLHHPLIGVIGGDRKAGAINIARIIACQLAATHCYTDVKMAFLFDGSNSDNAGQWEFARWLPHVWAEDRKIRYVASKKEEVSDVCYELARLFRKRAEEQRQANEDGVKVKPHIVLFLADSGIIEEELLSKYIFEKDERLGLSVVILSDTYEHLPNACDYIVENDSFYHGIYNVSAQKEARTDVAFDEMNVELMDQFARRLANLEVQEVETGGEIPSSLTFFDLYGVSRPSELDARSRWLKNRTYDNIRGLIGQKAGGIECYLDVHEKYHGPHGLVAGTTGSGKSETLQTYMLSLALNYSPDDISFFIIDYKGGGMANLFNGLPHLAGQISNLSGNQVHRAMVSIKSENRRRQRIFSENGVNNINAYTRLVKSREASLPVPHLFIIIDEFAELKKEEPDFMRELISVAQVGRSLGVHLVLATQKPSGTVDDNIWSNSRFRLCLRVQDKEDSMDMLHKSDAAYLTQAGRCYLQVGSDEVYELFQSGWSGAPYDEALVAGSTDLVRLLTLTGRVETTGGHIKSTLKKEAQKKWMTMLCIGIDKALCLNKVSLKQVIQSSGLLQDFIRQVFQVFRENGIDYAQNHYNSSRLENLIRLYAQALPDDWQTKRGMEAEDYAVYVMGLAEETGLKLPATKEKTQLDAVVDYLRQEAAKEGYTGKHQLWMPVLPERIYLQEFAEFTGSQFDMEENCWKEPEGAWDIKTVIGRLDDPASQSQLPLQVSFAEGGHLGVIGSVVSGKSTFIQTLLYALMMQYSPKHVNIYGIDFSSKMMTAFEEAPHVGGIACEGDEKKIAKLFHMLEEMLEERKNLLRGGNYIQYVQAHGVVLPAIILVIDNFSAFKEKTEDQYEKQIITLSKEGVGHGIFLVISAGGFGINELPGRIAENMKTMIALELADRYAYSDVLHSMKVDVMPETGVKGRGLVYNDGQILEFQTALSFEAEDDYQRMEKIADLSLKFSAAWVGPRARRIPEIPEKPVWEEFEKLDEVIRAGETKNLIPVGYDEVSAEVYSINLSRIYCYLITGSVRTGKSNYMKVMALSSRKKAGDIYVIDAGTDMNMLSVFPEIHFLRNMDEIFQFFKDTLTAAFQERNVVKKKLESQGAEEEELFEASAEYKPIFIYIADLAGFILNVYEDARGMSGFLENLIRKGRYHNIYFIAEMALEKKNEVISYPLFADFSGYQAGVHFGGNTVQNTLMNFDYLSYQGQSEVLKPGIGQLPSVAGEHSTERIIVPLARIRQKREIDNFS